MSVVCTNYNKGDWIGEAIESFLRQEASFDYEILVIDDKSTDHSPDIIRRYAEQYPDKIRAFYNAKNLGITKTWTKVCKQARGHYIARCDGDDYWIDNHKLQKQVDLLASHKESRWCSTDYNIITPEGETVHRSAFESGLVDRATSYAQMLVTKGFTMSSTWLVETDLMREINAAMDAGAVDDTFNIQLDLFNKTTLTYLPEATVVYRVNEGSDSRPIAMDSIIARNERLLKTQLEYIEKYKNVDYEAMLKILLPRDMKHELLAIERLQLIYEQRRHIAAQDARVKNLEASLAAIVNSKKYKLAATAASIGHAAVKFPVKVVRKLLWLDGRRRYARYYQRHGLPSDEQRAAETKAAKKLPYKPRISVIVPTYNTDARFFQEMLASVQAQTYDNWELVFVDDASPDKNVRQWIQQAATQDARIVYKLLKTNQHIAGATNEGFHLATGEFVSLFDHDDVLHPSALFEIAKALNINKDIDFIYTDEDKIDEKNKHIDPFIKPDWNQELLYSVNYITHFTTIRKTVVDKIGGERGEYNGAQDWDLFLRATHVVKPETIYHIPKILYSWRVHNASTAKNLETKPYVFEAQRKLLVDNLRQRGITEDQFSVQGNPRMKGAWNVSYVGQDESALHAPGAPAHFDQIKGLSWSAAEIIRYFGHRSIVRQIYTDCQYTVEHNTSGGNRA